MVGFTPASGGYVYIETSSPRRLNDTARIESIILGSTPGSCVSFWYHMYGTDVHYLNLYTKDSVSQVRRTAD